LEEIGERSQALLDKTKAPRFIDKAALFVDKKRDSGEVVKLVELLRDAITGYQVRISSFCLEYDSHPRAGFTTASDL